METVVALIIAGGVLFFLETILPGLISGILGALCWFAAVAIAFSRFGPATGVWVLVAVGVLSVLGAAAYVQYFPSSRVAQRFVSKRSIGGGGSAHTALLNENGVALTTLRPSGMAMIRGKKVDVVTEGAMLERGTAVKVVAVEGLRVVVRAVS